MDKQSISAFVYGVGITDAEAVKIVKGGDKTKEPKAYEIRMEKQRAGVEDILARGGIPKDAIPAAIRGHVLRAVESELTSLLKEKQRSDSADAKAAASKAADEADLPTAADLSEMTDAPPAKEKGKGKK